MAMEIYTLDTDSEIEGNEFRTLYNEACTAHF